MEKSWDPDPDRYSTYNAGSGSGSVRYQMNTDPNPGEKGEDAHSDITTQRHSHSQLIGFHTFNDDISVSSPLGYFLHVKQERQGRQSLPVIADIQPYSQLIGILTFNDDISVSFPPRAISCMHKREPQGRQPIPVHLVYSVHANIQPYLFPTDRYSDVQ